MTGFLERVKKRFSKNEYLVIKKAYLFARNAHKGKTRKDGKREFSHLLAVARKLEKMNSDFETISAGLLHDIVEDTSVTLDDIKKNFNENIVFLVDACTKISSYKDNCLNKKKTYNKILKMGKKDDRVFRIKIIDRLHNLHTWRIFSKKKKLVFAKETLEFYVPLAERIGMLEIKNEMKMICKKIL
ncbi:MAG: HD domain-containing protein [Candidatus Woesearchaeota archaeon]